MPFKAGEQAPGSVPFKKGEDERRSPGKPLGAKNRSTIARKVLEMRAIFPKDKLERLQTIYPEITNSMTVEEIMTIIQVDNAVDKGDDKSYRALMDSAYGAPKQETETTVTLTNFSVKDVIQFEDDNPQPEV